MARQPQVEDGSSSRMQSAPINISYGNRETQRFWRDHQYDTWNPHQFDEDLEEEQQKEKYPMMQSGFSAGVIEDVEPAPFSISRSEEKENEVVATAAVENVEQKNETQQKMISEMSEDLFEQLLAENERKLRQLISYVENVHLVLK